MNSGIVKLAEVLVVDNKCEPILVLVTCERFKLIGRLDVSIVKRVEGKVNFLERNSDAFQGLGKFPRTFSITLGDNSKPVLQYRKRIPNSLLGKLKSELDRLVVEGIILPVEYPTDWVNNLQLVEKPNGELRICLDPKALNECKKGNIF